MLVWIVPLYLFLYGLCRLYAPKRVQQRRYEFANIFKANIIGTLIIILVLYLLKKHPYFREFSTRMVFYFFVVNVIAEELERNCIRYILHSMRSKGYNQKHILLIGYSGQRKGSLTGSRRIRSGDTVSAGSWTIIAGQGMNTREFR